MVPRQASLQAEVSGFANAAMLPLLGELLAKGQGRASTRLYDVHGVASPCCSSHERESMKTIILLFCSNVFMTFAWYGHLKYGHAWPLWKAILVSWLIALLEYCLAVPANRLGFGAFTGFQLKIIQEAITVAVFIVFAITFLKEKMAWNYAVSFALLIAAVVVAFAFRPGPGIG
jgi:uncharacterized protein (DUF486 family)